MRSKANDGPLKVLQVVDRLGMGGAETWLMELLRFWSASGEVQMDFLLTSGNSGIFDDEATALGARLFYVPYGRVRMRSFVRDYRRILRKHRYDAIHHHADFASGWQFLWGLGDLPNVRITHLHNPTSLMSLEYASSASRVLTMRAGRMLVRKLATHVCATSAPLLEVFRSDHRHPRPSLQVLHCGFPIQRYSRIPAATRQDVRAEFGWPSTAKIVLTAGRLDFALDYHNPKNQKNTWLALNVARLAAERDPRVHLLMVGDGPSRDELSERVEAWGLSSRLKLTGIRRDLPRLMGAADILLFPSRVEGLGMAAVEAQAAGIPVLMSDTVPAETTVVPALVTRKALRESVERWAEALLDILERGLPYSRNEEMLQRSPFAIETSARSLCDIIASARA